MGTEQLLCFPVCGSNDTKANQPPQLSALSTGAGLFQTAECTLSRELSGVSNACFCGVGKVALSCVLHHLHNMIIIVCFVFFCKTDC